MRGYKASIERLTLENTFFRRVLYTGARSQLVLMCLGPGEEIGLEVHKDNDQFFRFEQGQGKVTVDKTDYEVSDGDAVVVPAGTPRNVVNSSAHESLKLYTIYTPPHHLDGIVHKTKAEAEADSEEFDGKTTE